MSCLPKNTFQPIFKQVRRRKGKRGKNAPFGRLDAELLAIQINIYGG